MLTATRSGHGCLLIMLGLLVATSGCRRPAPAPPPAPPPTVDVARPVVREVTEWDDYTGRLAAVDTVEIRPRVSGYLQSVHFTEGDVVKQGDLLFVIDPRPFRAALSAAEADLTAAQSRLELARSEQQRVQNIGSLQAVAAEEIERRVQTTNQAQAGLAASQARVEQARLDLEFTEIRAPIAGRAGRYEVTPGNLIAGGAGGQTTLLTTIVSLDPIYCYFDASEAEYLKYTRLAESGARRSSRDAPNPVRLALSDRPSDWRTGRMNFVDNRIDLGTGTIRGRAIFDNKDGASPSFRRCGARSLRATSVARRYST